MVWYLMKFLCHLCPSIWTNTRGLLTGKGDSAKYLPVGSSYLLFTILQPALCSWTLIFINHINRLPWSLASMGNRRSEDRRKVRLGIYFLQGRSPQVGCAYYLKATGPGKCPLRVLVPTSSPWAFYHKPVCNHFYFTSHRVLHHPLFHDYTIVNSPLLKLSSRHQVWECHLVLAIVLCLMKGWFWLPGGPKMTAVQIYTPMEVPDFWMKWLLRDY